MNVIVFTDSYDLVNGVSTIYQSLVNWVNQTNRFKLTIVSPKQKTQQVIHKNVTLYYIRPIIGISPPSYPEFQTGLFLLNELKHLIAKEDNVVHIATQGPFGILGAFFARRHKIPMTGYYHTDFRRYCSLYGKRVIPIEPIGTAIGSKIAMIMNWLAYHSCSVVLVQTEEYVREVKKYVKCPVEIIPTGVDIDHFSPPEPIENRGGMLREKYLGKSKYLAIFVGRIALEKNLSPLIDSYQELEENGIKIVMVGDGPLCESIQKSTRIPITGYLKGADLVDAYRSADILIFPSQTDTYGLVVLEAMACGTPVVCSDIGGPSEIIEHSSAGVTCDTKNSEEILDSCLRIIDKDKWLVYAKNARLHATSCSLSHSFDTLTNWFCKTARINDLQ